jgi:hypothetical protein
VNVDVRVVMTWRFPDTSRIRELRTQGALEPRSGGVMLIRPFPLIFAALLSACSVSGGHFADRKRDAPTEIGNNDRIVVVLASYIDCEDTTKPDDCKAPKESTAVESSIERCVGTAIRARIPAIDIMRAREFREKVFPGIEFKDSPRSEDDLLVALSDPETRNKMEVLGLRYILVLQVETSDGQRTWGWGAGQGGVAFVHEWDRRSHFQAIVVDILERKRAGILRVSNLQKKGSGFGIALIIPFPIYYASNVESQSCRELGLALADFLKGKD